MNTAAMAIEIESLLCFLLKVRFWKFRKNPITPLFEKLYSPVCTPIVTQRRKAFFPSLIVQQEKCHQLHKNESLMSRFTNNANNDHKSINLEVRWNFRKSLEKREMFSNPIYFLYETSEEFVQIQRKCFLVD